MKKTVKKIIATIIAAILIFAIAVPVAAFDFEKALEEESPIQTLWFTVGEENEKTFFDQVEDFGAVLYSSDEDVIEINGDGTYSAVGEGEAYIAVEFPNGEFNLYKCDVQPIKSSNTVGGFANNDNSGNSSTVDPFEMLDEITQQKQEEFENKVNGMQNGFNQFADNIHNTVNNRRNTFNVMMIIGPMIFALFLGVAIYIIVTTVSLSKTSMGKKELPVLRETENTIKVAAADRTYCPKCGKEFGDALFCAECGISKSVKNQYVVPIDKRITAQKFEKIVNEWLAENPYICDCEIQLETKQSVFSPFVNCKFFVKKAVIEYSVADQPQNHQYGFAFLYKFRVFGPIGYNEAKHVAQWNEKNPDCKVISTKGGRIQHRDNKGGIYAQYYNYVFFKKR